jgi:hypothetical protein
MTWWVKAIMKARIGKLGIAKVSLDMQEVSAKEVQLKKGGYFYDTMNVIC